MPSNERIEAHLRPILFPIAAASCVIFFWIAFTQEGDFRLALVLGARYCIDLLRVSLLPGKANCPGWQESHGSCDRVHPGSQFGRWV